MTKEDLNSIYGLHEKTINLKRLSEMHQKDLMNLDYSVTDDSEKSVSLSIRVSDDSGFLELNKSVNLKCVTVRLTKLNELLRSEFEYLTKNRDKAIEKFNNLTIK